MVHKASPRLATTVGQRLLLGVAPALLAVVLVLVLSYYGEFGRQAPSYVVGGAAVLAVLSLVLTWFNARHLTLRIRRLAGASEAANYSSSSIVSSTILPRAWQADDLGRIELELARLNDARSAAERELALERAAHAQQRSELATLYGATARDALQRLDEVRLPVHILIDAPFGELNENQEELLVSARAAADDMDAALRRLILICEVDREALLLAIERVSLNDAVRSVLPMLRSTAERRSAQMRVNLDPSLPRVYADRTRLAEALALIGIEAAQAMEEGGVLELVTRVLEDGVGLVISPALSAHSTQRVLGERLLIAQGGRVTHTDSTSTITLPTTAIT